MKRWLRNRKAVSPVIAALLLIAISVAAAVITYSWVMTMIEGQGSQAQTTIRFEEVVFDVDTDDQMKYTIRNSGGVTAVIQTVYIYKGETRLVKKDGIDHPIPAGDTMEFGITESASEWGTAHMAAPEVTALLTVIWTTPGLELNTAYSVKVVTDNGFTIEGTFYSPGAW